MKKVTMKDISNELGISIVSVSNALSNKNGVSDEIRKKIIRTAEQLGYQHSSDKPLKEEDNNNIGIIIAERYVTNNQSFYWNLYRKLATKFSQSNHFVILEILSVESEKELVTPNILGGANIKGIIVLGQVSEKYLHLLNVSGKPLLLLDFYNECSSYDTITTDNFYSSYLITNYLIANGHKNIAYVGNIHATSSILDRYLGYCKSLLEHNIPINDGWLLEDRDEEGAFVALKLPQQMPTAFFCNCDEVAYRMVNCLKADGFCVPQDISVVGFDNYIYSKISKPPITTVKVNSDMMTTSCVELMLKKIKYPDYAGGRTIIVGDLVFRDSVAKIKNA